MKEIYQVLDQLLEILQNIVKDESEIGGVKKKLLNYTKPTQTELLSIEKIIILSFIENVARKKTKLNENKRKIIYYEPLQATTNLCFLNTKTMLLDKMPEYISYVDILETRK